MSQDYLINFSMFDSSILFYKNGSYESKNKFYNAIIVLTLQFQLNVPPILRLQVIKVFKTSNHTYMHTYLETKMLLFEAFSHKEKVRV